MNKLKTFRKLYNIRQEDLAKVLNTTQKQISMYETHARKLIEEQIETILNHYNASIEELLEIRRKENEETGRNEQ